jgi:hypothetical protein
MPELLSCKHRLGRLKEKRSIKTDFLSSKQLAELDLLIAECESLVEDACMNRTIDGSRNHPFGQSPFTTLQTISRLDRADRLITNIGKATGPETNNVDCSPDCFLYPTLKVTVVRQFLVVMLSIRTRLSNTMAFRYDQPSLMEIFFVKSPSWMGHFLGAFLPDQRRVSSYPPDPRSHPMSRKQRLLDLLGYYRGHPFQVWKFPFALTRILMPSCVKRAFIRFLRFSRRRLH